jgi:hypothetical protein
MEVKLKRYSVAVIGAAVLTLGVASATFGIGGINHPDGKICTAVKGNTTLNGYDAEMDSGNGVLDLTRTPAPGYCTDYYHPTWGIFNLRINPWSQCYSQWGYLYKSNQGSGKDYGWTGNINTVLTLECIKVGIDGSW